MKKAQKNKQQDDRNVPKGWTAPEIFNGQVVLAVENVSYEESLEESSNLSRFLASLTVD